MRLSKITIDNFRGIKHVDVELERDMTVLIGENNVGKTSVLEALQLCLDIVKSDKTCNFTEYDFYRDATHSCIEACEPIGITLSFFESKEHIWPDHITQALNEVIVGNEYSVIKLRVTAQFDESIGEPVQKLCFLDESNNELNGRNGIIKELRSLRPFFFLTALRAAKDQFHSQSTYWASFLRNRDIDEPVQRALEEELYQVNKKIVDSHSSFKDVTEEIKRVSELVAVGNANPVTIDPAPADVYNALRHTVVNLLTESNAKIPIRSHGEGTQSLSVLLLFSAYLKTRLQADIDKYAEPVIAIEEPEAHLHPNAVRAVWHLLSDLPGQKIVATHSGDILSEVPVSKLRRMSRKNEVTLCKRIPDGLLTDEELRKFNHRVRRNRGELLFARCWLLVEGETEVSVFDECADLMGINFHALGIRIIEYSQAGGPGIFIKVADELELQWHFVADGDEKGLEYAEVAKQYLNGRDEVDYISVLKYSNIDILLCCSGYGKPYEDGISPQKKDGLNGLAPGSLEYWEKVYRIVNKTRGFSKPAAAFQSIQEMKAMGGDGVPQELQDIINKAIALVGETP